MSGLPREIVKWLQSLDLSFQIKTPKWDLSNGYLLAEIFSCYFPQEISMPSFINGHSTETKLKNWSLLKNFIKRQNIVISTDVVEGTMHSKDEAAKLMINCIYAHLTNRKISDKGKITGNQLIDFNDFDKNAQLPMHARSTAARTISNNLSVSEVKANPSLILNQQKAQHLILLHRERRIQDRQGNADRFECKPTIGQNCVRGPPKRAYSTNNTWASDHKGEDNQTDENLISQTIEESENAILTNEEMKAQEVQVRQMAKYKSSFSKEKQISYSVQTEKKDSQKQTDLTNQASIRQST